MNQKEFIRAHYKAGLVHGLNALKPEKVVFYGIKYLNITRYQFNPLTIEQDFMLYDTVLDTISHLTPRQLLNIFPVSKIYSGGHNSDWKNYFTTMDTITEYGLDTQIAEPFSFLWDYTNNETRYFLVHFMSVINDMRQLQGSPDMITEFFHLSDSNQ